MGVTPEPDHSGLVHFSRSPLQSDAFFWPRTCTIPRTVPCIQLRHRWADPCFMGWKKMWVVLQEIFVSLACSFSITLSLSPLSSLSPSVCLSASVCRMCNDTTIDKQGYVDVFSVICIETHRHAHTHTHMHARSHSLEKEPH